MVSIGHVWVVHCVYGCQEYKIDHNLRFGCMKLSMFYNGENSFPKLKGKAAEINHITKPLLAVWTRHMDHGNTQHRQIKLALQLSCRFDQILAEHKAEYVIRNPYHDELVKCAFGMNQALTSLGNFYHAKHHVVFNMTLKNHYLNHIALMSRYINPSRVWCYSGEDMMDKCKKVVRACLSGTPTAIVVPKAIRKYSIGLACHLSRLWKKTICIHALTLFSTTNNCDSCWMYCKRQLNLTYVGDMMMRIEINVFII